MDSLLLYINKLKALNKVMSAYFTAKFCHQCGHSLISNTINLNNVGYCTICDISIYADPKVAAVVIVSNGNEILLVRRSIQPHIGKWSFISGYVNQAEQVESAAIREVKEEIDIDIKLIKLQGIYSGMSSVILIVYRAIHLSGIPKVSEEVSEFNWFSYDSMPDLPFPYDDLILRDFHNDLGSPI
jgi:8-oxo-dGTP diphosphatase